MDDRKKNGDLFRKIAVFIVDKRNLIFLLYIFALIFSVVAITWTVIENDVTAYLPEDTETRMGIEAMNDNFVAFATGRVMVSNVSYETALRLSEEIGALEGVEMVTFDNSANHYKDASALFDVNFAGGNFDEISLQAVEDIREILASYDCHIDTQVGLDMNAVLAEEMGFILVIGVVIIMLVMTLTSRAYMEVPVILLTFAAAAVINMGTNFIYEKISFISNSIAVVMQLALSIDYAIILCHRFSDEFESKDARSACIEALAKSIPEVSASSLTTVSGLAALAFMKFAIGMDMAIVLIKAILFSLLSVFTLMPGLLMLCSRLMKRTRHKKLLPPVYFLGRFAVVMRRVIPPLFLLVVVAGFWLSSHCNYCFSFNDLKTTKMTEQQHAYFEIKETFGTSNMVALIVPAGDYEAEAALLEDLEACPEVISTMGLSGIEALDGYTLTAALTPREFSELIGLDNEVAQLLYGMYAAEQSQTGEILSGLTDYKVPLFDMFLFLKEQLETHNISLGDDAAEMEDMLGQLDSARTQLQSDNYSRMVVYLNLPEESEETFAFLSEIRAIAGRYYDGDYYVVGNSTNCRDLSDAFVRDNLIISILSAFFVILVLLFTFKSVGLPILLILVIQGSIWINFSIPTITGQPLYFLGYLTVNAIMMGANIDYAIVISSHYQEKKEFMPHKEAIIHALNAAFPTVFTSGTIMASAGMLIGQLSSQPVVSIMGNCIGRGTSISVLLVLFVLPAFLVLGDSIIERTSFRIKALEPKAKTAVGSVRVKGHVHGYVSGMLDADIDGVLRGQFNATLSTDGELREEGDSHD